MHHLGTQRGLVLIMIALFIPLIQLYYSHTLTQNNPSISGCYAVMPTPSQEIIMCVSVWGIHAWFTSPACSNDALKKDKNPNK